jgi:hypothetical protein
VTTPTGTWTVVYDGAAAGTAWDKISWNATVPAGAAVLVQARAADSEAALPLQAYQPISNNVSFVASGRYIQVQTRLNANTNNDSPILFDLTINSKLTVCDVNLDGSVNTTDLTLIRSGIGQTPAAGDPRDANVDGKITINDVRLCTLRCTKPQCAL